MVASWRVKMAMSLGLIALPERMRRFLILDASTPWRRRAACTWFSPAARSLAAHHLAVAVFAFPLEDKLLEPIT